MPLYIRIADSLARDIASGAFPPYERLASESALMKRFAVSRVTVRAAITRLVHQGLVHVRQGKGTFVAGPVVRQPIDGITSLHSVLVEHGFKPERRLVEFRPATPLERAGTPFADPRLRPPMLVRRLFVLHDKPFALVHSLVAASVAPLSRQELANQTLQQMLERHADGLARADVAISARPAPRDVALLLKLPRRRPVLMMSRVSRSRNDEVLDDTSIYIVPDTWEFGVTILRTESGADTIAKPTCAAALPRRGGA